MCAVGESITQAAVIVIKDVIQALSAGCGIGYDTGLHRRVEGFFYRKIRIPIFILAGFSFYVVNAC